MFANGPTNDVGIVVERPIENLTFVLVQNTYLNIILMVVDSNKKTWYTCHRSLLLVVVGY